MGVNITISDFLVLNGAIVILLVIYMLFWRPNRQPSRLNFRGRGPFGGKGVLKKNSHSVRSSGSRGDNVGVYHDFQNAPESLGRNERVLNVIFQFNGHDFDAFEVLGVPAGSPIQSIENAYSEMLKESPEDSREFLQMAFNAIKRKLTQP